jgi:hypothetical protein
MMTRQIIQLRTAMRAALLAMVLAVSFLPAFAPPAHAGSQPYWGGSSNMPPSSGGPDEPDDKNPRTTAIIRGPQFGVAPAGQVAAPGRAQLMVTRTGIARWFALFQVVVKAYWIR